MVMSGFFFLFAGVKLVMVFPNLNHSNAEIVKTVKLHAVNYSHESVHLNCGTYLGKYWTVVLSNRKACNLLYF